MIDIKLDNHLYELNCAQRGIHILFLITIQLQFPSPASVYLLAVITMVTDAIVIKSAVVTAKLKMIFFPFVKDVEYV